MYKLLLQIVNDFFIEDVYVVNLSYQVGLVQPYGSEYGLWVWQTSVLCFLGFCGCLWQALWSITDLSTLLKALKMEKYEEIFQKEEIDLDLFLTMSEEEFSEIGITTLGARRRLSNAIKGMLQFC